MEQVVFGVGRSQPPVGVGYHRGLSTRSGCGGACYRARCPRTASGKETKTHHTAAAEAPVSFVRGSLRRRKSVADTLRGLGHCIRFAF